MYITKQQLRELGFDQPDKLVLPFLEKVNQKVADCIDAEIPKEIKQNYSEDILQKWFNLRERYNFDSPIVQDWLKSNIKAIDSITTDWTEIVLSKLRTPKSKGGQ